MVSSEFLFDFRNILSFQFILTLHRFGLDMFHQWKTSNRGRHITPSDPLHDKYCQDTVACCNCRCVYAKGISRSDSRSFLRYKCHADASHTSLLSASFFFFNTEHSCVFIGVLFLQTRTVMCTAIFGRATSDKIMGGLRQEDVEAFLHVTMVAIALTGFLQQFRDEEMTHHTR